MSTQTWREAIEEATAAIERAKEHRRDVMQAAYEAGLPMTGIAAAAGISRQTSYRIINADVKRQRPDPLESPASVPASDGGS